MTGTQTLPKFHLIRQMHFPRRTYIWQIKNCGLTFKPEINVMHYWLHVYFVYGRPQVQILVRRPPNLVEFLVVFVNLFR
jgi:hypothetical protein